MVPIVTPVSAGDDETDGVSERVQQGGAVVATGERIREVGVELAHERRPQQEVPHVGRLPIENLADQEIRHHPTSAVERAGHRSRVIVAHGQDGQAKGPDPSRRADAELLELCVCDPVLAALAEQRGRLLEGELEVRLAHLADSGLHRPTSDRQLRVAPTRDHQPHLWRKVLAQQPDPLVDRWIGDRVEVVEHDDERSAQCRRGDHQLGDQHGRVGSGTQEGVFDVAERAGSSAVERGVQEEPETSRTVVRRVEVHPDADAVVHGSGTLGGEDALARARTAGDDRDRPRAVVDPLDEPRTSDQIDRLGGEPELPGDDRHALPIVRRPTVGHVVRCWHRSIGDVHRDVERADFTRGVGDAPSPALRPQSSPWMIAEMRGCCHRYLRHHAARRGRPDGMRRVRSLSRRRGGRTHRGPLR